MRAFAAAALLGSLVACIRHPQTAATPEADAASGATESTAATEPPRTDVTLEVDNRGTVDITIYVTHDGLKERLGRSVAARRESLTLPARLVVSASAVRLVAETAGARAGTQGALTTEVVALRPGMRLVWTIESELQRSHLGIY